MTELPEFEREFPDTTNYSGMCYYAQKAKRDARVDFFKDNMRRALVPFEGKEINEATRLQMAEALLRELPPDAKVKTAAGAWLKRAEMTASNIDFKEKEPRDGDIRHFTVIVKGEGDE